MLITAVTAPLIAALLLATQSRSDDRSANQLAGLLSWLLAGLGLLLLIADVNPITLQLGTLVGTEAELIFSLNPTQVGLGMAALSLLLGPVAIHLGASQEQRFSLHVGTFALQSALVGAFLAGDLATFYICFEGSLLPALWVLTRFGRGSQAQQSALRFLIYTMAGSFLMLVAIWTVAAQAGTLAISALHGANDLPAWCGLAFILAFAVKTPLVPFHGWQRPLYEAAPIGPLVLIAGLMGKMGLYGFLNIVFPVFTVTMSSITWLLICLCVCSIIFGALMALRANSWRAVLAYSSLSHLGFAMLAVVVPSSHIESLGQGMLMHMVGHAIAVAAMAVVIAGLERRSGSSEIKDVGGLATQAPGQAVVALMTLLVAVAIPGTVSFTAEVMLLGSIFAGGGWFLAVVAGLSLVLTAGYLLRLARTVVFGPAHGTLRGQEMTIGELAAVIPLLVAAVILGFAPRLMIDAVYKSDAPTEVVAMVEEQ